MMFVFSNQAGAESDKTSGVITNALIEFIQSISNIQLEDINNIIGIVSKIVRKTAHLAGYALGGILAYCTYNSYKRVSKKEMKYIILFMILYAMSDELHQYFVPRQKCRN